MRAPNRRRQRPREIQPAPSGVSGAELSKLVTYVGSSEHKVGPSFAGKPRPRADATICDSALSERLADIQRWLRQAVQLECFGPPWEGRFPRYVWCKVGEIVYQARLVNRELGHYKGWQLKTDEWPTGIDQFEWNLE